MMEYNGIQENIRQYEGLQRNIRGYKECNGI